MTSRVHAGERIRLETKRCHKNGSLIPVLLRGVPFSDSDGTVLVYGLYQDITEKKQAEEELRRLSETDELTQLFNRRKFTEELEKEFALAKRYKTVFSLIMLDVDHFKTINDTHGHLQGDEVLKALAAVCRQELRNTDIPGRWGGEEFIFLLKYSRAKQAEQIAERIRLAVKNTVFGPELRVTCSLGVARVQAQDTLESLIKRVDENLYEAKRRGRDQVVRAQDLEPNQETQLAP